MVASATASRLKVVSFAWADPSGAFLGSPQWADDWVKKNAQKFPTIHFSQTPVAGAENFWSCYLLPRPCYQGSSRSFQANTSTSTAGISGSGMATGNYGETWFYTYEGTATATTTTMTPVEVPYTLETRTLYASAYGGPTNALVARNSEWTIRQEGGAPAGADRH